MCGWQGNRNALPSGELVAVLQRARDARVRSQIITGGLLSEWKGALQSAKEQGISTPTDGHCRGIAHIRFVTGLYAATWASSHAKLGDEQLSGIGTWGYFAPLDQVISEHLSGLGRVVAVGEWGVWYAQLIHLRKWSPDLTLSLRL